MTPKEALAITDAIHRKALEREQLLRRQAAREGIPYEELCKRLSKPRHDLCEKLNALSAVHAIESYNLEQNLGSMRGRTQAQDDGGSAFEQAVGKAGIAVTLHSDDPVSPAWGSRQQREWQRDSFPLRPGKPNATTNTAHNRARRESLGFTPKLHARCEESDGSLRGDGELWPSGESGSARALEARAYQQIRGILSGRRTVAY